MTELKRIFNVRVRDTAQLIDLMKKLGTLNVGLEAESRPGLVRIVVHGTEEEIRGFELKIKEFMSSRQR